MILLLILAMCVVVCAWWVCCLLVYDLVMLWLSDSFWEGAHSNNWWCVCDCMGDSVIYSLWCCAGYLQMCAGNREPKDMRRKMRSHIMDHEPNVCHGPWTKCASWTMNREPGTERYAPEDALTHHGPWTKCMSWTMNQMCILDHEPGTGNYITTKILEPGKRNLT